MSNIVLFHCSIPTDDAANRRQLSTNNTLNRRRCWNRPLFADDTADPLLLDRPRPVSPASDPGSASLDNELCTAAAAGLVEAATALLLPPLPGAIKANPCAVEADKTLGKLRRMHRTLKRNGVGLIRVLVA